MKGEVGMSKELISAVEIRGPISVITRLERAETITDEEALELSDVFSPPAGQLRALDANTKSVRSAAIGHQQRWISDATGPTRFATNLVDNPRVRVYPKLGIAIGLVDQEALVRLMNHPLLSRTTEAIPITKISPIDEMPAVTPPSSTYLEFLKIPQLWALGLTGEGVLVGHLDTGIDTSHVDLSDCVNKFIEYDLNGRPVQAGAPRDSDTVTGHGTHTAGIIAGRNWGMNVYGVAPASKLDCALVLGGEGELLRMVAGLEWIANGSAKIVNGSMGLIGESRSFELIMERLRALDILPVIAIGNDGEFSSRAPGNSEHALSVGACDKEGRVLMGSSSEEIGAPPTRIVPTVIAPGLEVLSCAIGGKTRRFSGTSQAAPFVTGICALLKEAMPSATAGDLETAVKMSATRRAGVSVARGNFGVPDALKAHAVLTGATLS